MRKKMDSSFDIQLAIIWYLIFLFSTTAHEAAHSFVSWKLGDETARRGGQVTLNPIPHIQREPFGMLVVPLLSYAYGGWMIGWASAPYDPVWAHTYPKRAAWMGLAGPAANLILVLAAGILIRAGLAAGIFAAPESIRFTQAVMGAREGVVHGLAVTMSILFTLNLLLLVFNLIPVPPLDGTSWMELILSGRLLEQYRMMVSHPALRTFGILIAWYLMDVIFPPVRLAVINILYSGIVRYG
jgi:Zn-dependent protease